METIEPTLKEQISELSETLAKQQEAVEYNEIKLQELLTEQKNNAERVYATSVEKTRANSRNRRILAGRATAKRRMILGATRAHLLKD